MFSFSAFTCCLLAWALSASSTSSQQVPDATQHQAASSRNSATCHSEDLSHSVLIECSSVSCGTQSDAARDGGLRQAIEWPSSANEVLHISSSRAGERLKHAQLANIDHREDDHTRMFNINTTLYVETPTPVAKRRKLAGFGASLPFARLAEALESGQFERLYGLIFDDLFGCQRSSANLNLLRLRLDSQLLKRHDLAQVLAKLDSSASKCTTSGSKKRLELLLELDSLADVVPAVESLAAVVWSLNNTQLWALSLQNSALSATSAELLRPMIRQLRQELPSLLLFVSVSAQEAPELIDRIKSADDGQVPAGSVQGLLVRAQPSTPYNLLAYVREHAPEGLAVLTLASSRAGTRDYGDWKNGQDSAVELMNHLKYGSSGYLEDQTLLEVLEARHGAAPGAYQDAALYSLHESHGLHFKGPKFYSLAHFSRYLPPGSFPLDLELFTQPNMFAAHYAAFMLPDGQHPEALRGSHIVAVISNENEHLLPFRLAVDRRVVLATFLEPKSLNTFLIKFAS